MKTGIELIAAERQRQMTDELYSKAHDDMHDQGELAHAAVVYAAAAAWQEQGSDIDVFMQTSTACDWPWEFEWLKISDSPQRNLEKAGALLAAEIDRLQRKNTSPSCEFCTGPLDRDGGCVCDVPGATDRAE